MYKSFFNILIGSLVCFGLCASVLGDVGQNTKPSTSAEINKPASRHLSNQEPARIVKAYIDLSSSGAHLTEEGRTELSRIAGGAPENAESVFTTRIISGYKILDVVINDATADVAVQFENVGSMIDDFHKFKPRRTRSQFTFQLKKNQKKMWEVYEAPAPHMDWRVVVEHLEKIRKAAAERGGNPAHYRDLITKIRNTASQPLKD